MADLDLDLGVFELVKPHYIMEFCDLSGQRLSELEYNDIPQCVCGRVVERYYEFRLSDVDTSEDHKAYWICEYCIEEHFIEIWKIVRLK